MTIWQPRLADAAPVYLEIMRAIESDVRAGRLRPGERLPTHRALAERLGVNVGTVSRAYAEARRRGLVRGEVGRGTFVAPPSRPALHAPAPGGPDGEPIDLAVNRPLTDPAPDLAGALRALADAPDLDDRVAYGDPAGSARARRAGARWLGDLGVPVEADRVVVCAGAQHAVLVALAGLAGPGETVLAEALTYPGFLGAARTLGLRVRGVAIDDDGLVPESLEAHCRTDGPRLLYCMPGLQNPTGVRLSTERRHRLAELARTHDLTIVQDDVQDGVVEDPGPSLARLAPDHVLTIASLSKSFVPGLRAAFLAGRSLDVARATETIWSTVWMAPTIGAEVAIGWIEDGTGRALLRRRREEMLARHALAERILDGVPYATRPASYHLWLPLPGGWEAPAFVDALERRGVRTSAAQAFAVEPGQAPRAVRVSLSGPPDRDALARGLVALRRLLDEGAPTRRSLL